MSLMSKNAPTAHDVQAIAEDVSADDVVTFMGESFKLPDRIAYMAFLIFAKASKMGLDTDDEMGMAAMYDMIHGCLNPEDEKRFDNLALDKRASGEEIFDFVAQVMERVSARPTRSPGDSSQQAPSTSRKSKAASRSPAGAEDLARVGDLLR
jgi:hypothetical protein